MDTVAALVLAAVVGGAFVALMIGLGSAARDENEPLPSRAPNAAPHDAAEAPFQLRRLAVAIRWSLLVIGIAFLMLWAASGSTRGMTHSITGLSLLGGLFVLLSVLRPARDDAELSGDAE